MASSDADWRAATIGLDCGLLARFMFLFMEITSRGHKADDTTQRWARRALGGPDLMAASYF